MRRMRVVELRVASCSCELQLQLRVAVASCELQLRVASCELRVASCELRVASCELRVASCELRVASCELQLRVALQLRVTNRQNKDISNPRQGKIISWGSQRL